MSKLNPLTQPAGRSFLERLAILVACVTLAATALAASARVFWLGDLAVHFRPQYAVLALLAGIVLAVRRRLVWALAAAAVLALNAALAAPSLFGHLAPASVQAGVPGMALRIASINVLYSNSQHERVIAWLRTVRPDAAVLVEVTPEWRAALGTLSDLYPYQYYAYASGPINVHGTLLVSRWPLRRVQKLPLGPHGDPGVSAVLETPRHPVHLLGVHPSWPMAPSLSAERNRGLALIARVARAAPAPLVVAGDFNITPFSPHFAELLRASGLQDAARGVGWLPTWPTFLPPAGIAIDHVLYSRDFAVAHCTRGPRIGSDHWPLLVDLLWPRRP